MVLCVILIINAIVSIVNGYFVLIKDTRYYLQKYGIGGTGVETLGNFIGFGVFIFALITAFAVYGILKNKRIDPRFLFILHGLVISSCIMYLLNIYELLHLIDGLSINIMVIAQLAVHTVLFPINFLYFRKRKNVYDDVL